MKILNITQIFTNNKVNSTISPVEIKTAATVDVHAVKNFGALDDLAGFERGFGAVICQTEKPYLVSEDVQAVSPWAL